MQLSYNLIKNNEASIGANKTIETEYNKYKYEENNDSPKVQVDLDEIQRKYEGLASGVLRKANNEKENIISQAIITAKEIEKRAYEKGHEQGLKNGYEDGVNKGYVEAKTQYDIEGKALISQGERILHRAQSDYDTYMEKKKQEIINLAIEMAKIITQRELIELNGVSHLIEKVLEGSRGEENLIIRCHPDQSDSLREKIDYWKIAYAIKEEIFVLEDTFLETGNAVVEKSTGKTQVGLEIGFKKLEEALFNK